MLPRTLRMVGFAVVTMVGAVHVSTAKAAPSGRFEVCDNYAWYYAQGYCDGQGKQVCGLSYTCLGRNATPIDVSVDCC